mgnify:FL=1|jgi:DNA-directed RNA polymerase specialized sigma24 family protein|tara:strand:- start:4615 stop:5253 length:639 start_codon:yes stop_codon:yes gene_type:complete
MTPAEYITINYTEIKKWLYNITKGEKKHLYEDFIHEVILIFLSNHLSQQAIDSGTARFFLVRIGLNQWRSSTSPFHYQYRDSFLDFPDKEEVADEEYDMTEDMLIEMLLDGLDKMYNGDARYEATIMIIYFSMGSNYSAVGRELNIPNTTIRKIVLRGIDKLKQTIKQNNDDDNNTNLNTQFSEWNMLGGSNYKPTLSMVSQLFKTKYFQTT